MSIHYLRLISEKQNFCVRGYLGFTFEYVASDRRLLTHCSQQWRRAPVPPAVNTGDCESFESLPALTG